MADLTELSIEQLLEVLQDKKVELWVENGNLKYKAPTEVLDIESMTYISSIKKDIIAYLERGYIKEAKTIETFTEQRSCVIRKLLPLCKKPYIISYQNHAYYLGILSTCEHFEDYFFCNFINLYYHQNTRIKLNIVTETWYPCESYFLYNKFTYNTLPDLLNRDNERFAQLMIDMLCSDYYILGKINEYYVPKRPGYKREYEEHDFLVYGFDKEKKEFNLIGYNDQKQYQESMISFEELQKGIFSFKSINWIDFLKINKDYRFAFKLENLKILLNDYLQSKNSYAKGTYCKYEGEPCTFGINAIESFANDLKTKKSLSSDYLRYFRLLLEHKECMNRRVIYLLDKGYIADRQILMNYEKILNGFQVLFISAIKISISFSSVKLNEIIRAMLSITKKEAELLNELYHLL